MPFQEDVCEAYKEGYSGILNAPTGTGKTYALLLPAIAAASRTSHTRGLNIVWITPVRAVAEEVAVSARKLISFFELPWEVGIRTGDTSQRERSKQQRRMPQVLITTPESLHLLLASKKYSERFRHLHTLVVDEWHELMGSKRGVQIELACSRLRAVNPSLQVWGISATIGNMKEAMACLLGVVEADKGILIKANIRKEISVTSVLPDVVEQFPWSGHLGIKMADKVLPIIQDSRTTLIFTNTRSQTELWYQRLLELAPELSGALAMHHGSLSRSLRVWVEAQLHAEKLRAVVCTSSLDLGVDFRPVETIIQVGGPKGVARFIQRAGRSGHQPGASSNIYFVPTHSLELLEAAALREAVSTGEVESRRPYVRCFDVLVQYVVTLAVSDGFVAADLLKEVRTTHAFASISDQEWAWVLDFVTTGGKSLYAYDDFHKVEVIDKVFQVNSRRIAMRHRLSIGTIVSDAVLKVKYLKGKPIGTIEEWFVSKLKPGEVFWFAGRSLELFQVRPTEVLVKRSKKKAGKVPAWMGGRMPLSSQLASMLRKKLSEAAQGDATDKELIFIQPLLQFQAERSAIPAEDELLIEYFSTREGYHLCVYPFEGRFVHEGLASLLAWRIGQVVPLTFSISINDYGFELLSGQPVPVEEALELEMFSQEHLLEDIQASLNATEMARRCFRDIAHIAGLVFSGYPGKAKTGKHLQSSAQLLFDVFRDYDPDNLLLKQAYEEVLIHKLEEFRLREALKRINQQSIVLKQTNKPTPFAFPVMVDRLRERLSTEQLDERIARMTVQFTKSS